MSDIEQLACDTEDIANLIFDQVRTSILAHVSDDESLARLIFAVAADPEVYSEVLDQKTISLAIAYNRAFGSFIALEGIDEPEPAFEVNGAINREVIQFPADSHVDPFEMSEDIEVEPLFDPMGGLDDWNNTGEE